MKDLLLVNPPLIRSVLRHAGNDLPTVNLVIEDNLISSMNVGLVSIASYLVHKGFSVKIVDLYQEDDTSKLAQELTRESYRFIGVSCVTAYSYLAALECFETAKRLAPDSLTVGGGAHLGPLGRVALDECLSLDAIVRYEGELALESMLKGLPLEKVEGVVCRKDGRIVENQTPGKLLDLNLLPPMNFALYPDYLKYMPFIEESRGCFARCSYCVNCFINQGRIRHKSPETFERDVASAVSYYGTEQHYIIESLSFGVNPKLTLELLRSLCRAGIRWGVEFRVDAPWEQYLGEMYESGCRMIDVGLESASLAMLKLMRKTNDPQRYVDKASALIREAMALPKMNMSYNVLFFPGETPHTMRETASFIFANQHRRLMISVFPVFLYPGVPMKDQMAEFAANFGTRAITDGYWEKIHAYPIDLSRTVSFNEALLFSKMLQRMFLPEELSGKKDLIEKDGNTDWNKLNGG